MLGVVSIILLAGMVSFLPAWGETHPDEEEAPENEDIDPDAPDLIDLVMQMERGDLAELGSLDADGHAEPLEDPIGESDPDVTEGMDGSIAFGESVHIPIDGQVFLQIEPEMLNGDTVAGEIDMEAGSDLHISLSEAISGNISSVEFLTSSGGGSQTVVSSETVFVLARDGSSDLPGDFDLQHGTIEELVELVEHDPQYVVLVKTQSSNVIVQDGEEITNTDGFTELIPPSTDDWSLYGRPQVIVDRGLETESRILSSI